LSNNISLNKIKNANNFNVSSVRDKVECRSDELASAGAVCTVYVVASAGVLCRVCT